MHRYPIKLTLKSGVEVQGKAIDTQRNEAREECMKMTIDGELRLLVLDTILILEVTVDNPHFKQVRFD